MNGKRKYDLDPTGPFLTTKKVFYGVRTDGPPKSAQIERSPLQLTTKRKCTEESEVRLADVEEETSTTSQRPSKDSEEAIEAAVTDTINDQNGIDEHSVPIWHRYIETSPPPRVNPVRLQVDRLRTSCGDMMIFIEGIARTWKLEPLTASQKEALAYDSEVCEVAMKKLLDAYLQKLEGAGIIPCISNDSHSSPQVSNGNDDMGEDPVGSAGDTVPTSPHSPTGMAEAFA